MDYFFWRELKRQVCSKSYQNLNELKVSISKKWTKMDSTDLVKTCKAFCGHIEAVIEAKGGHIE